MADDETRRAYLREEALRQREDDYNDDPNDADGNPRFPRQPWWPHVDEPDDE